MAEQSIDIAAAPQRVWDVLADPSAYADWVVGTQAIPRADGTWPTVGSALEYEIGIGPFTVGDRTVVVEADPPRLLVLRAEAKVLGSVGIRLELAAEGNGTRLTMLEEPQEGALDLVHNPAADMLLGLRNGVALERLRRIAERR